MVVSHPKGQGDKNYAENLKNSFSFVSHVLTTVVQKLHTSLDNNHLCI